jgi:HlyD family secretion protein
MTRNVLLGLIAIAPLLAGCGGDETYSHQGYVAGTYVNVAAEGRGRLVERPVRSGDWIEPGDLLFALDVDDQTEAVAVAEARLAQARAQLANLKTGLRDEEISVIAADLEQARTTFANAENDYRRKLTLRESGISPQSVVDDAKARRDGADSALMAVERRLQVARLPARPEEVQAAELNVEALQASLKRTQIQLAKRTILAPVAALVEDTFYEIGELVGSGKTVVSLLPDQNRLIRFFIPEPELASLDVGQTIKIACDGCSDGMTARIVFVATEAEFTPPIIFSQKTRHKLVFLVEARPDGEAMRLKVGQPIDVSRQVADAAS